jgi:hypothetical protein
MTRFITEWLIMIVLTICLVSYFTHLALLANGTLSFKWAFFLLGMMLIWGRPMVAIVGVCTALVALLSMWG